MITDLVAQSEDAVQHCQVLQSDITPGAVDGMIVVDKPSTAAIIDSQLACPSCKTACNKANQ